jgi:hypothetical protein
MEKEEKKVQTLISVFLFIDCRHTFFFFERRFLPLFFFFELLSVGDKMHLAGQHADLVI